MNKPSSCKGCPLYPISLGFSTPDGAGTSGVVIVGEALGREEYIEGMPLRPTAPSGSKLNQVIQYIGATRNQFRFWNIVACNPPYNVLVGAKYEQGAISHCMQAHFRREVGNWQTPMRKTILALGNIPMKTLTGYSGIAKEKQSVKYLRGYALESEYGYVVPTYHPSYLLRGMQHLTPALEHDLRLAMRVAKGLFDPKAEMEQKEYLEHPSLEDVQQFFIRARDNQGLILTYDIETAQAAGIEEDEREKSLVAAAEITQIQFSLEKHKAIVLPWRYPFIAWAEKILALPNVKAGFNCYNFDDKVLGDKGVKLSGKLHDLMWMFKHYQPRLDRNLQSVAGMFGFPVPWKHFFERQTEFYGACDVDAPQYILEKLPKAMVDLGIWEGYMRHIRGYYVVLKRGSDEGIRVNPELHTKLTEDLKALRATKAAEINALVPKEIIPLTPKAKDKKTGEIRIGYVKEPKVLLQLALAYRERRKALKAEGRTMKSSFAAVAEKKLGLVQRGTPGPNGAPLWAKQQEFKASQKQIIAYIKNRREYFTLQEQPEIAALYEVPKTIKKGVEKESTGKDVLGDLAEVTGDELMTKTLEFRSIGKLLTNDLPNWEPDPDERVHTEWHFGPPQGQMGSRAPNILNCSKHTETGQLFRRIVEAPKGYVFVEFDKRSFHVAIMGFLAKSRNYIRFSQLDPHSIFSSWIIPPGFVPPVDMDLMDDQEILAICKQIKKHPEYGIIRQKVSKPTVLGNQLGLGPMRLHRANHKHIHSFAHAKQLQGTLARRYPEVERYKDAIKQQAYEQRYLKNNFGRIQRFYEIYRWSWNKRFRTWDKSHGSEADQAVGFAVQSNAFGMITEEVLRAEKRGLNEKYRFVSTVHDSLVYMPEIGQLDSCIADIGEIMTSPCPQLTNEVAPNGLVIGVEYSVGRNWQKWHETKNPEGMQEIGDIMPKPRS